MPGDNYESLIVVTRLVSSFGSSNAGNIYIPSGVGLVLL